MRAMVLTQQKKPLVLQDLPLPQPSDHEILIKVSVCGVCRTDLHIADGDLKSPHLPLVLGHEIVGTVEAVGKKVKRFQRGERVGVPWLGETCGECAYCKKEEENLCEKAVYTGYQKNGGFAEYTVCHADYAIPLGSDLPDEKIAPLLCAGLIGYRCYKKAAAEKTLGLYGFGVAAHLLTQLAVADRKKVFAFTRPGDRETQDFARKLGATWAGSSLELPPEPLDACIIFAPVGPLVPQSLKVLKRGGRCICGGIHMSDIPSFPYADLWGEKSIHSVSNLTRTDAKEFFEKISHIPLDIHTRVYPLEKASDALRDFREGKLEGAAVLKI